MSTTDPQGSLRAARDLARTASQLAYEAAALAQLFDEHGAREASVAAAQASIQAAKRAFILDDVERSRPGVTDGLALARETLDDAQEAVAAAKAALDAAIALTTRAHADGGREPSRG